MPCLDFSRVTKLLVLNLWVLIWTPESIRYRDTLIMDRLAGLREARPLVQCNSITALPAISASEDSGPTMILRLTDY